jgi:hypothetical protein
VTPKTLAEAVAGLRAELDRTRAQLRHAQEIPKMKFSADQLTSLRRRVAFYCHPDRGGDVVLMRDLNTLFDVLEELVSSPKAVAA